VKRPVIVVSVSSQMVRVTPGRGTFSSSQTLIQDSLAVTYASERDRYHRSMAPALHTRSALLTSIPTTGWRSPSALGKI
jgi:hypothetical protein